MRACTRDGWDCLRTYPLNLLRFHMNIKLRSLHAHSMAILFSFITSFTGHFNETFDMKSLLDFLQKIGAHLVINPYP